MTQVVDYSSARPNPHDLAAAGYVGAMRYLAPLPNQKVISGDELASLHANGLAVGLVYEAGAGNALSGAARGASDGRVARQQADELGWPSDRPIYFAVDTDAQTMTFDAIDAYGRAFGAETGRPVGVYGSWTVIEAMLDRGVATYAWQTVAWSHGKRSNRAHLYQRADVAANPPPGCDVNEVLQDDWGGWSLGEGDDMTPEQATQLKEAHDAAQNAAQIASEVRNSLNDPNNGVLRRLNDLAAQSSPDKLAAAIAAKLPADTTIDKAVLTQAVKDALKQGTG